MGLGKLALLCEREVDGVEWQAAGCTCSLVPGQTTRHATDRWSRGDAGNPSGNPVIATEPAGMRPVGLRTVLDLRRCATTAPVRRVVSYF